MKQLALTSTLVTFLALAFAVGFAKTANAAPAGADLDVSALTADLSLGEVDRAHPRRLLLRAARSMVHAVRANCDCGDVECAQSALAEQAAKILANLPERCDETCQTRVTEALTKIAERIEARVAAANCEPRPSRP
ncbi:MAG: hypothetical protein KDH92_09800 [Chloroflexi bacterium]|nr:hypothetical protein [Chloroflexota bacterium]